ncbi:iron complex transport system substrate-binding protein [Streptoalloteichus tenebrarius]|uniref:Iron complex transport system substrate-binding protein n=1 Tax=Streptoalloteichus tenebrarius (strain ATCC 17920 / DSM 40477 / JCM 4838 / CBS 697.72 / NBRC 16177 / NCIMB 11028 / NRRL B-12390 / A12253. 1 / ISP 5477) TaxID=1933 RepID=A0ABT1HNH0_STRSD|nr:ABC transporter substrate-binding protein [Streptoalloteichus tenebrarius]MCP2257038.1 iron complex transport system substrate-binding protein [Streptoalloteichus tenebrarius]BFF00052.1 ABC transporter substrate-binding protein [Streptoalloteichus tenebrarius]
MTGHSPRPGRRARGRRLVAGVVALLTLVGLTACANREQAADPNATGSATTSAGAFPVEVSVAGGKPVRLEKKPQRIVSLSPTATEMLFAVGAGRQVVAVDKLSNHPADAPRTELSGFNPNVEAVAGHNPDLVVASDDRNNLVAGLAAVKVPVLLLPAASTLDGTYEQLKALGRATGHAAEGADVAQRTRADVEKVVKDTPRPNRQLSYYHELDSKLFSATSRTFIGQVYNLFGLRNIADAANSASGDYPQLSAEHVVNANPDLIFLADMETPQAVAARPGWQDLAAVRGGNVVSLDPDTASRWGPRVVELVRQVGAAVAKAGK